MNGYERMMAAVNQKEPDRVPIWELIINRPVIEALHPEIISSLREKLYEWGSQGGSYQIQADFIQKEDLDGITIFEDSRPKKWINKNTFIDEWNITWQIPASGIPYAISHPIQTEKDLDSFTSPDPNADYRLNTLKQAVKRFKGEKVIVFLSHDSFEFSHYLRGMENLLMDYLLNPDFAKRVARIVVDYKKRVIERAIEEGADIICTGDDYAHRKAPIMSPKHFQEFVLPYLQEVVDVARKNKIPFIKHTDGNIWPIIDSIINTGINVLDPLEPIADMDIGRVKEAYGNKIALAGNVDCGELLSRGSQQGVIEATKETLAKAAPKGGYILASSNSIHPAVKPENYKAMVETGKKYGRYPLDQKMVEKYRSRNYIAQYV